ncbi:fatty acid desaturase [Methylocaldum szegediense]|uniref:fatty acid desaturase n=1 Tax=Methylocaldum szegediense TaxID=73780 RepID=UPI000687C203|nr:fatty acid desaturase [Methylocaldum szegediense]
MDILTTTGSEGISRAVRLREFLPPWWCGFGISLVMPSCVLGFFAFGPHQVLPALAWTLPFAALFLVDCFGPSERRLVPADAPPWFFDGILYVLVSLQALNVFALGLCVSRLKWAGPVEVMDSLGNLLAVRIMVGTNFCCAAICPAHEFIHRHRRWQRMLGRFLLVTVFFDHFAIAHKTAHHARLGSTLDPSTAAAGESYEDFFRRTAIHQWRIAWGVDRKATATGVAVEALWLVVYTWLFGLLAAVVYLRCAYLAVRILEAVNYFQHYGLTEGSGLSRLTAWRNDSAISLFLFLGLTRHADHHRRPGVPYPRLRALDEGPAMPCGYWGMAVMVLRRNEKYRSWMESQINAAVRSEDRPAIVQSANTPANDRARGW